MSTTDQAQTCLEGLACHSVGVSLMAPKTVFLTIRACGLLPQAANILKQEMLAKGGEVAVPNGALRLESPRVDCVIAGTLTQYRRLISILYEQPFELPELAAGLKTVTELATGRPEPHQLGTSAGIAIGGFVNCDKTIPGVMDQQANIVGHAWNLLEEQADFLVLAGSDAVLVRSAAQEIAQTATCPVCAWIFNGPPVVLQPSFPMVIQQCSWAPPLPNFPTAGPVLAIPEVRGAADFLTGLSSAGVPSSRLFVTAVLDDSSLSDGHAAVSPTLSRLPRLDAVVLQQRELERFTTATKIAAITRLADRGVSTFITDTPSQLRSILTAAGEDPWNRCSSQR